MGWEQRRNQWYYYRTRRIDGRVVRTYFGRGPRAKQAAAEDAKLRKKERERRRHIAESVAQWAVVTKMLDEYDAYVDFWFRAEMTCRGYHYHRGQWRKRRGFDLAMAEWKQQQRELQEIERWKAKPRHPRRQRAERKSGPALIRRPFDKLSHLAKSSSPRVPLPSRQCRSARTLPRPLPTLRISKSVLPVRKGSQRSNTSTIAAMPSASSSDGTAARPPP